ncbi:MAG: S8 family serine peptidase [Rhodocyclaceae bacterium]|nr:S8 family serine peptidase [Rhodocyclaceae bacterium]
MLPRYAAPLFALLVLAGCGGGGGGGDDGGGDPSGPASISGTASVPDGVTTDSDVNDPNAVFTRNDTPATAQPIPNPGTVTGFATKTPFGQSNSRFASDTDEFDGYQADLVAGQTLVLRIGGWNEQAKDSVDLDLQLYDANVNLIATSEGIEQEERIVVPTSGSYIVLVRAFAGGSAYELSLGAELDSASASAGWNRVADMVPGEAIVTLASDGPGATASALGQRRVLAGGANMPLLVSLEADNGLARAAALSVEVDDWTGAPLDAAQAERRRTIRALKRLAAAPGVASASPNTILRASAVPNDPFYALQWHYPVINLPAAWDITDGSRAGSPVVVAVVDTGVVLAHPDLQGQLVAGYDFVSDAARALDGDGIDSNPNDPGDRDYGGGSSWHGTHVAGTVAAATSNGSGIAGVAGGARVMPVRVLGRGGGTAFDILHGIRFAAGLDNVSGTRPSRAADIINLSLGGPEYVQAVQDAVTEARAAGVIVVAAAGNEAVSRPSYPAAYDGVISVSALDINGGLSDFSNFGSTVDVAAPGGSAAQTDVNADGYADNILSTYLSEVTGSPQASYGFLQGTSMASPHVAGVLALMRAVNADISPAQVDALLSSGQMSDDIGNAGRDNSFGHGRINAYQAVIGARSLIGNTDRPAVLASAPTRLDFGGSGSQLTLRLTNQGDGGLAAPTLTRSDSWISISSPTAVNGGFEYRVTAARGSLPAGAYGGSISVASSIGNLTVPVTMLIASNDATGDAGRVYFLLLDPETGQNLGQVDAAASGGRYTFRFDNVAAGEYTLVGGSDLDNDDFICGSGESCGAWPVIGAPDILELAGSNLTGLVLSVGPGGALRSAGLHAPDPRGFALQPKD